MWCSRFLKDHITRTSYKKCENFSETVFVVNKQVSKQCSCKKNNTFLWIGVTKPVSSENRFWKSDLIWLLLILKPFESWPFYRFDLWGDMNVFKKQQQNNEQSSLRAAGLCQLISPVCVCCINCQFVRISDGFFICFLWLGSLPTHWQEVKFLWSDSSTVTISTTDNSMSKNSGFYQ